MYTVYICTQIGIFTLLLSTPEQQLHPLVFFLASRHEDIGYDVDLDNLPVEKWSYLMSAFYQRLPLMICDPEFVVNIKKKIDTYTMLMDSPQWFNENGDLFMGLHSIEFGKFNTILTVFISNFKYNKLYLI